MCGADNPYASADQHSLLMSSQTPNAKPKGRRVRLHEMGHWCCSVVGTCLSHEDLMTISRKWKVEMDADARRFDVHGFFVKQAGTRCDISRALEKLLDSRYSGLVKRVSRITKSERLEEFWDAAVNDGLVAGAYWAIVSHRHVPEDLRTRVFGDVHMMSHIMGGTARKAVGAAAELQTRVDQLERHRQRWSKQARAAIETRDERIRELEAELIGVKRRNTHRPDRAENDVTAKRAGQLLIKRERALVAARTKTRQMEGEIDALNARLQRLLSIRKGPETIVTRYAAPPTKGLCGKAVLYLGGRKGSITQMRKVADEMNVDLLHHDGGLEQSEQLIGDLVSRCDAVVCPINCINHQACVKAKRICKRLNKPFLPIRSSGRSTFSRALDDLDSQLNAPHSHEEGNSSRMNT